MSTTISNRITGYYFYRWAFSPVYSLLWLILSITYSFERLFFIEIKLKIDSKELVVSGIESTDLNKTCLSVNRSNQNWYLQQ